MLLLLEKCAFKTIKIHSENSVTIVGGTDHGIRFYLADISTQVIQEKSSSVSEDVPTLENIECISFFENEIFAAGNSEYIYVFRTTDFGLERMIRTTSGINFKVGHAARMMFTVGDKLQIWQGD